MTIVATKTPRGTGQLALVPCLPLDSVQRLLTASDRYPFQRLLLPFDDRFLAKPVLEKLFDVVQQAQGELILLHVGRASGLDEEGLFSTLRGLQANAQQLLATVRVDSMGADTAVSLLDYAHEHHIDLIVLVDERLEA